MWGFYGARQVDVSPPPVQVASRPNRTHLTDLAPAFIAGNGADGIRSAVPRQALARVCRGRRSLRASGRWPLMGLGGALSVHGYRPSPSASTARDASISTKRKRAFDRSAWHD